METTSSLFPCYGGNATRNRYKPPVFVLRGDCYQNSSWMDGPSATRGRARGRSDRRLSLQGFGFLGFGISGQRIRHCGYLYQIQRELRERETSRRSLHAFSARTLRRTDQIMRQLAIRTRRIEEVSWRETCYAEERERGRLGKFSRYVAFDEVFGWQQWHVCQLQSTALRKTYPYRRLVV